MSPLHSWRATTRTLALLGAFALASGARGALADTQVNYDMALSGSLWGTPFQSTFAFNDKGRLSGLNMNVQGTGFRAGVGDAYANWDNLGFAQRSYRGLSLGVPLGKAEATLIGGSVVTTDEFGQQKTSPIYGIRAALPVGTKWRLSASRLFSSDNSSVDAGSITTIGINYRFSQKSRLSLETARSNGGSGWQLSGESAGKHLSLRASYRQTETGFSDAANPLLRTNRNGGFLGLSYRLSKPLTFSASSQRYSDGNQGNSSADSLRLQFSSPKRPQLALFRESRSQHYAPANTQFIDSTRATGIELSHRIGATNFSLSYAQVARVGSAVSSANGTSDQLGVRFNRQLNAKTRLSFSGSFSLGTRRSEGDGQLSAPSSRNFAFVNVERRISRGANINTGLQYQTSDVFGNSGRSLALRAGFKLPLNNGTSMGLQYQKQVFGVGNLQSVGSDTLYLSFAQNFNSGRKAPLHAISRAQQKLLGQLSGRVFEDRNGNGRFDEGETGIPGISLNLKGNVQGQTDQDGQFSFSAIELGGYRVRLITKTLPIELTTTSPTDVHLQVSAGQKLTLDFPVMKTGKIQGVVFRDDNRNGRRDSDEPPLSESLVQVEDSEIIAFTDDQGRFNLSGLPPRHWKVFVDTQTRGDNLVATNATPIEVVVPANDEVTGIELGLSPRQKEVINTFHKET